MNEIKCGKIEAKEVNIFFPKLGVSRVNEHNCHRCYSKQVCYKYNQKFMHKDNILKSSHLRLIHCWGLIDTTLLIKPSRT